MANQILNFRDETMNIQKNIQEISDCTEKIKMVNDMRDRFLILRSMIVFAVISLVFWIFGFVVYFISCNIAARIVAVAVGALVAWLIFNKAGGKMSAAAIASVILCYLIIGAFFQHISVMLIPLLLTAVNGLVTFLTYKGFTNSANKIMPQ